MLAISVVGTVYISKAILYKETHAQTAERTSAAYVLRAREGKGLAGEVAAAARRLPGVADASGTVSTTIVVGPHGTDLQSFPARGVDIESLAGVLSLGVSSGSLTQLRGNSVAVSVHSAAAWGWHLGDRVNLWLGDGTPATVRVVAEYTRPLGFGEVIMPRRLVADHVTQMLDDDVFVSGARGVRPAELERTLETLSAADPNIEVVSRSSYEANIDSAAQKEALEVYVLLALIVLFCALALMNALTMAIGERIREFAQLRLLGATKRQIRAMIRTETLIMIAYGLTTGTLIALPGLALLNRSLTGSLLPSVPMTSFVALLAFYAIVGLAATVLPTRWSLRDNPVNTTS
jgi:putative ABC transport system permease protein